MTTNEYYHGAEFADEDDLHALFDATVSQLSVTGTLNAVRPNVAYATDGLPMVTEDDIEHNRMGARTVKLPVSYIHESTKVDSLQVSRKEGDDLTFWHIPAFRDLTNVGTEWEVMPEHVVFIIPKDRHDEDNIYLEDTIEIQKSDVMGVPHYTVTRDRPLTENYTVYESEPAQGVAANADTIESDFGQLTKDEVADLIKVVQLAA